MMKFYMVIACILFHLYFPMASADTGENPHMFNDYLNVIVSGPLSVGRDEAIMLIFLPIMLFPSAPYYVRLCSSIFQLCSSMLQLCPSTNIDMHAWYKKILEAQFFHAGMHASQKIFRVETYNSFGKSWRYSPLDASCRRYCLRIRSDA